MPSIGRSLRHMPVARALAVAELVLLARRHVMKLEPHERRRVVELVRRGRGRKSNLNEREQRELSRLVQKAEPREFLNTAAKKVVGVSLPGSGGLRRRSGATDD